MTPLQTRKKGQLEQSRNIPLENIDTIIALLKKEVKAFKLPIVTEMIQLKRDPFKVLISTILSLRTKDETTREASYRLFAAAATPAEMVKLSHAHIEKLIYPVGFYKNKARSVLAACKRLLDDFNGIVPDDIDTLLTFKGVGRKTANLVITLGYNKPGICVDVHVHRITNRWGMVKTKTPDETEMVLRTILPKKHWIIINDLLVAYGQNLCRPTSPFCSKCKIKKYCKQVNVGKTR
ncbi:MAG: endonuclease III [Candidatus Omnitrophica bacterium]|nr:endonuclease III [Candidatus Omnitrophota bacterium]